MTGFIGIIEKGVIIRSYYDEVLDLEIEFLVNSLTGELLTNPLESIINCLANMEVLAHVAKALSLDSTESNLDSLFETLVSYCENCRVSKGAVLL